MVAEVMDAVRHEPASTATPVVEVTGLGISLQRRDEVVLFTGVRYEKRETEPAGKVVRKGKSVPETALKS